MSKGVGVLGQSGSTRFCVEVQYTVQIFANRMEEVTSSCERMPRVPMIVCHVVSRLKKSVLSSRS